MSPTSYRFVGGLKDGCDINLIWPAPIVRIPVLADRDPISFSDPDDDIWVVLLNYRFNGEYYEWVSQTPDTKIQQPCPPLPDQAARHAVRPIHRTKPAIIPVLCSRCTKAIAPAIMGDGVGPRLGGGS